ncbi:hypothetical protein FGB62_98g048 [Gracilaria domingensis]|nr:hypothetical protein FGB62_98g048 [Gracilaria domingensis]
MAESARNRLGVRFRFPCGLALAHAVERGAAACAEMAAWKALLMVAMHTADASGCAVSYEGCASALGMGLVLSEEVERLNDGGADDAGVAAGVKSSSLEECCWMADRLRSGGKMCSILSVMCMKEAMVSWSAASESAYGSAGEREIPCFTGNKSIVTRGGEEGVGVWGKKGEGGFGERGLRQGVRGEGGGGGGVGKRESGKAEKGRGRRFKGGVEGLRRGRWVRKGERGGAGRSGAERRCF